jgi:DNA invertase Pin-like site-specific DNA recombinase
MKVALYARVSTSDKDQDPETQLLPLRDFCLAQGWEVYREYVDQAPANDLLHRVQWRQLLDDAAKRRFSVVLVFKLDRAFRSVKHMHDTLAAWELVGVSFQSLRERFETSTALGRLLLNLLASLAEFELELIRERVKAGMERARRQGRRIGRPRVIDRRGFSQRFGDILERLIRGDISRRQAAKELKIGYATLKRLLDAHAKELQIRTASHAQEVEKSSAIWPRKRVDLYTPSYSLSGHYERGRG